MEDDEDKRQDLEAASTSTNLQFNFVQKLILVKEQEETTCELQSPDPGSFQEDASSAITVSVMGDTQLVEFVKAEGYEPPDANIVPVLEIPEAVPDTKLLPTTTTTDQDEFQNMSSIAIAVKTKRRSASKRFLERIKLQEKVPEPPSPTPPIPSIDESNIKEESEIVTYVTTNPEIEVFPQDRCANCLKVFQLENEKVSFLDTESSPVSVLQAITKVFRMDNNTKLDNDVLHLCETCAEVLNTLYTTFERFMTLAAEESYIRFKLRELERQRQKKRRGRKPKIRTEDPLQTTTDNNVKEQENPEWTYFHFGSEDSEEGGADDEDFHASASDLDINEDESSSSSSEEDYVPVKKTRAQNDTKKLQRPKTTKGTSKLNKSEHFSSDEDFDIDILTTSPKKNRAQKTPRARLYEAIYVCNICDQNFLKPRELKRHLRENHNQMMVNPTQEQKPIVENPYKCKNCENKCFPNAMELRIHFRNEHSKRIIRASGEDEENASLSESPQKVKRKKKRPIQKLTPCEICGKTFLRADQLTQHLRVHTGEKPFTCKLCPKTFSNTRGLQYHEITHSDDRPYCCTVCGSTFKRLHHLTDHERNHKDNIQRPFSCENCGKGTHEFTVLDNFVWKVPSWNFLFQKFLL